jgi:hypothetical protein
MEKNKILDLINLKVKEHTIEVEKLQNQLLDEKSVVKKSILEAAKLLALKDKILVHKTAIFVLEGLKKELYG